jgi:hypothetical protein
LDRLDSAGNLGGHREAAGQLELHLSLRIESENKGNIPIRGTSTANGRAPTEDGCAGPAARAGRGAAASDGRAATSGPDGCSAAQDGRASVTSGGAGGGQEVRAGYPMLIVNGPDRRVWPRRPQSWDWRFENPALFPCFWLESGYIPRHLTRKHGSQRPSGGSRASQARLLTRFRRNQPENYHYGATRFFYASAP